jgi:hypothetical protein
MNRNKLRVERGDIFALVGIALLIVSVYLLTRPSRLDVLEPYMRPQVTLDEIRQVADDHGIPLELNEQSGAPASGDVSATVTVKLDGSWSGGTLHLVFRKDFGLDSAYAEDRDGNNRKQWFCVLRRH